MMKEFARPLSCQGRDRAARHDHEMMHRTAIVSIRTMRISTNDSRTALQTVSGLMFHRYHILRYAHTCRGWRVWAFCDTINIVHGMSPSP
jgi:hypothetical protein